MTENDNIDAFESEDILELEPVSSSSFIKSDVVEPAVAAPQFVLDSDQPAAETDEPEAVDPVFAELATPKLPQLGRENRARLQMQSPNRIYFYWSVRTNPFQVLEKLFGGTTGSYQLVAKFVNLKNDREEIRPVDAEGNYWLSVEPDGRYQAEIGFWAPNRPYIRVIYSNVIETPRKSPSPRSSEESAWSITADKFARVLDASGFTRDAYQVAMAGDDAARAERATEKALVTLVGGSPDFAGIDADEVRYALLALASGVSLEELRGRVSEALFLLLSEHAARLSAAHALDALKAHFEVFDEEVYEEESIGATVYGASVLNFPRGLRSRRIPRAGAPKVAGEPESPQALGELNPLSSHSFGL